VFRLVGKGLLEDLGDRWRGGASVHAAPDGSVPERESGGADLDRYDGGGGGEVEGVPVAESVLGPGGEGCG